MLFKYLSNYVVFCFFFKQKTAYELRIMYWSSDVCSSDLVVDQFLVVEHGDLLLFAEPGDAAGLLKRGRNPCQRRLHLLAVRVLDLAVGFAVTQFLEDLGALRGELFLDVDAGPALAGHRGAGNQYQQCKCHAPVHGYCSSAW